VYLRQLVCHHLVRQKYESVVAAVIVTLWADNWWRHWSAGRRSVCRWVSHHLRAG